MGHRQNLEKKRLCWGLRLYNVRLRQCVSMHIGGVSETTDFAMLGWKHQHCWNSLHPNKRSKTKLSTKIQMSAVLLSLVLLSA